MTFLSTKDRELIRTRTERLQHDVDLLLFVSEESCRYCKETRRLLEEVVAAGEGVALQVIDFDRDDHLVARNDIDKVPAIIVRPRGGDEHGVRFFGIPSGYEFVSLLEAIEDAGTDRMDLPEALVRKLEALTEPLHLEVFVTPTCPYCPQAVRFAHKLAKASPLVRADMVEAVEFPHLVSFYDVRSVPKTVVDSRFFFDGALSDAEAFEMVTQAIVGEGEELRMIGMAS